MFLVFGLVAGAGRGLHPQGQAQRFQDLFDSKTAQACYAGSEVALTKRIIAEQEMIVADSLLSKPFTYGGTALLGSHRGAEGRAGIPQ